MSGVECKLPVNTQDNAEAGIQSLKQETISTWDEMLDKSKLITIAYSNDSSKSRSKGVLSDAVSIVPSDNQMSCKAMRIEYAAHNYGIQ